MSDFDDAFNEDDIEWVSKSEMKREMHKLQALGERLLNIKPANLKDFPITDVMRKALEESKRIKSHEASRRHLQYIGKIMRSEDIDEIQKCLDRLDPSSDLYLRIQNQAESWRERLIRTSDAEGDWFTQYPETDRQPFRALVRAATKEQTGEADAPITGGKNSKKLLQWIRNQLLN